MCLIVFTPELSRARISRKVLRYGFDRNDDGAGFAYIENGQVRVSKAYFEWAAFKVAYCAFRNRIKSGPLLIHFRWGTKGSNSARNTQPLTIYPDRLVVAHNGVITQLSNSDEDVSDSVELARLLRRLNWTYPFNKPQQELLTHICDDSSKLVFLSRTGHYTIINEKLGKWHRGVWYSDDGHALHISQNRTGFDQSPGWDDEDEGKETDTESAGMPYSGFWRPHGHIKKNEKKKSNKKTTKIGRSNILKPVQYEEYLRLKELARLGNDDPDGPGHKPVNAMPKFGTPPTLHQETGDHYNDSYFRNVH